MRTAAWWHLRENSPGGFRRPRTAGRDACCRRRCLRTGGAGRSRRRSATRRGTSADRDGRGRRSRRLARPSGRRGRRRLRRGRPRGPTRPPARAAGRRPRLRPGSRASGPAAAGPRRDRRARRRPGRATACGTPTRLRGATGPGAHDISRRGRSCAPRRSGPCVLGRGDGPRMVEVVETGSHRTGKQRRQLVGEHRLSGSVRAVHHDQDGAVGTRHPGRQQVEELGALRAYDASSSPRRRHCSSSQTRALPSQPATSCIRRPSTSWLSRKASV